MARTHAAVRIHANTSALLTIVHADLTRNPSSAVIRFHRPGEFRVFVIDRDGSAKLEVKNIASTWTASRTVRRSDK